ncbi:hypothetical protein BpHYR1_024034 [Brachionus plicatilis]|uniref:Uncharacterized protein n=1 Tax=Brachionus plicatilis TaxID=10195 RepID=A0A3M7SJ12_BRAPC|nr:hypothetical protein BpHYR1_024034 [Brachionus plicatilis]
MTQSCPNISLTQFKKPIRDCYLMMHDVGENYQEKTTEHDFSTDIFIFHLISHSSSSLIICCSPVFPKSRLLLDKDHLHIHLVKLVKNQKSFLTVDFLVVPRFLGKSASVY